MKSYKIIYTPLAKDDLRAIYSYIAFTLKEKGIAKKHVDKIRNEIRKLDFSPERYARVDWEPWNSMDMRKFSVGNYIIYYWTDNETSTVTVNRIFYGGRDVENIINV